jgi:menaquinone-dependent protoporphyrinogen oxidase
MSRILLLFHSIDGQTQRIAERIANTLARLGHLVTVRSADAGTALRDIEDHDAVLLGACIHYGHHPRSLEETVRAALPQIASRPNAFFSVCLSAGGPGARPAVAEGYLDDFRARTGWQPRRCASFAGALRYRSYNPFIRFMMRLIAGAAGGDIDTSRDYEYTDWIAVERFATEFARSAAAIDARQTARPRPAETGGSPCANATAVSDGMLEKPR